MRQTRWILPAAVFVLAACDATNEATGPVVPKSQADVVCDCAPKPRAAVYPSRIGLTDTQVIGVLIYGTPEFDVRKLLDGGSKIGFSTTAATKPVAYKDPAMQKFVREFGWGALNFVNKAAQTSDTVRVGPPPPPPAGFLRLEDVDHDGQLDAFVMFPVADLVKGGQLTKGDASFTVHIDGARFPSVTLPGGNAGIYSDTVRVGPPPPPPAG